MTRTDTLDHAKSTILRKALKQMQAELPEEAQVTLKYLIDHDLDLRRPQTDILSHIFASAVAKRLSAEAAEPINLYLKQYAQSQIELFNVVSNHLPFVGEAGHVANNYLAQFMKGHEDVALLDIGIGTGRQVVALLRMLDSRGALPRKMTIYGIEPMAEALKAAENAITQECMRLDLEYQFHGFCTLVEDLSEEKLTSMIRPAKCLCVNASFALHHIHGNESQTKSRENAIRNVRALNPLAFVLSEPNSDHYEQDIVRRFENCWEHFEAVFAFIDQLHLPMDETIKLKMFFHREIEDIVGNGEDSRYERHEKAETWMKRLVCAGFRLHTSGEAIVGIARHPLMNINVNIDFIGFDYRNMTLVAVMCGVPT